MAGVNDQGMKSPGRGPPTPTMKSERYGDPTMHSIFAQDVNNTTNPLED